MSTARTAGTIQSLGYIVVLTVVLPVGSVFLGNSLIAAGAHFGGSAAMAKMKGDVPVTAPMEVAAPLLVACPEETIHENVSTPEDS